MPGVGCNVGTHFAHADNFVFLHPQLLLCGSYLIFEAIMQHNIADH